MRLRVAPRATGTVSVSGRSEREGCVVVVNADDFGLCGEQNEAIARGFEEGILSSTSMMLPAPGFAAAARYAQTHPRVDVGVHLVLTSEWDDGNKWAPILGTAVPSLTDSRGYLWQRAAQVFAHADPEEAEAELRAQIDRAFEAGIDVSHLDSHMFTLHAHAPQFHRIYLRLARDYRLPIRAASRGLLIPWAARLNGGWALHLARVARRTLLLRSGFGHLAGELRQAGIFCPEYLVVAGPPRPEQAHDYWSDVFGQLPPGLTEIYCHPAFAQAGAAPGYIKDFAHRRGDCDFFCSPEAKTVLKRNGVKLIGYREIRDAMRVRFADVERVPQPVGT